MWMCFWIPFRILRWPSYKWIGGVQILLWTPRKLLIYSSYHFFSHNSIPFSQLIWIFFFVVLKHSRISRTGFQSLTLELMLSNQRSWSVYLMSNKNSRRGRKPLFPCFHFALHANMREEERKILLETWQCKKLSLYGYQRHLETGHWSPQECRQSAKQTGWFWHDIWYYESLW